MRIFYALLFCLVCLFALPVRAQKTYALEKRVSITLTDATLEQVLQYISAQYGVSFSYSSNVLADQEKVSLRLLDQSLEKALHILLDGKGVTYTAIGNRIIIRRRRSPLLQTIKGTVTDRASKAPVAGAYVVLAGALPALRDYH